MTDNIFGEAPIRSKIEMRNDIVKILASLHTGNQETLNPLIEQLKARAVQLDSEIQHDVLIFIEQVQFQYAYDPWHTISKEVQQAADHLLDQLKL